MITKYHATAPEIIKAIPPDDPELFWTANKIDLAAKSIHGNENANPFDIFAGMVWRLQERLL